jgi:two-component system OmpR family sensor kinase
VSIRLRLAIVFALGSAVLLALGGWLFVSVLSSSLLASIDSQLSLQAGRGTSYLSNPATGASIPGTNAPEYVVQVVDQTNRVRASSADAGAQPLVSAAVLDQARTHQVLVTQRHDGEDQRVLVQPVPGQSGWVELAGVSLESLDVTISRVTTELAVGSALFVLVTAFGAFALTRSALRPVERLRREVATLSERAAPDPVAVPRTHDEIAELATTMNQLLLRLRRSLERERSLVADASHELRTPFAVLRGELELAQRPGRSREELLNAVTAAAEEAGRLNRIADDLLLLSRGDQGQLSVQVQVTNIHELLTHIAQQAQGRPEAAGKSVSVDAPTSLSVMLDPDRIRQAIDNLIDNSLRFTPRDSTVTLSARAHQADVEIEVADDGPGFPAEFLPHAFERFRRPDSSRSRHEGGAGLGLAIVMAIAVSHGGTAVALNRTEGGAVVRIVLPNALSQDPTTVLP